MSTGSKFQISHSARMTPMRPTNLQYIKYPRRLSGGGQINGRASGGGGAGGFACAAFIIPTTNDL